MGRNLRILMWIDNWGDTIGWAIRIGLVVVGGILALIGYKNERIDTEENNQTDI